MLNELKDYFNNTSSEQIKKDWAESEKHDSIGPTIDKYMNSIHVCCNCIHYVNIGEFKGKCTEIASPNYKKSIDTNDGCNYFEKI